MATTVIVTDGGYTRNVKISSITPVSSKINQNTESLIPIALSSFKTSRVNDAESVITKIALGISVVPTYATTDGIPITNSTGGGDYWITG